MFPASFLCIFLTFAAGIHTSPDVTMAFATGRARLCLGPHRPGSRATLVWCTNHTGLAHEPHKCGPTAENECVTDEAFCPLSREAEGRCQNTD